MFQKVLTETTSLLNAACKSNFLTKFCLIGGFAVSRWSKPRATADIDFAIEADEEQLEALADHVGGTLFLGDRTDALRAVINFQVEDELGLIPVQLIKFPPAYEREILANPVNEKLGKMSLPIANWPGLVLIKLYAGSPLDLQDAENILKIVTPSEKELSSLIAKAKKLRVSKKLNRVLN